MKIIYESTKSKKRYKCPYCEYREEKTKLIRHIDNKHDDMIPEGYTSSRLVFNIINKKDHGTCIECGSESPWNENKCRYDRLCGKESCNISYKKKTEERIKKIYGKTSKELLLDPNQQTKMLANRRISGSYKWSNGDLKTYTGTYELKTLEFCDKVFGFNSEDVIAPGPVVNYVFNGEKHMWITDIFIAPYNLAIDCKDGGDNPNNRPMKEYREKQLAKEKAISSQGKYNYLRLTDNNFKQLIEVLTLLKLQFVEDNKDERIIRINENMFPAIGGFMPPAADMNPNKDNTYVVNYMMNNTFISDVALSDSPTLDNLYVMANNNKIKKVNKNFLENTRYNVYKIDTPFSTYKSYIDSNKEISSMYEFVFNKKRYTNDQILTEDVEEIADYNSYLYTIKQIVESTLKDTDNLYVTKDILSENTILCEDDNGYFLKNNKENIRTESRKDNSFNNIEKYMIEYGII